MNVAHIGQDDSQYPPTLGRYLRDRAPQSIAAVGNLDILQHNKTLAFFCSVRCPGSLILQTYDLSQNLRQEDIAVIGGFHSPVESECLTILLRGASPIVICPARSVEGVRVPSEYKQPLEEGRLLLLSPFTENQRRATFQMAFYRNQFVAALADRIFVAYAEPQGKTEAFCREVIAWGKPLYTLTSDANAGLIELGAKLVWPNDISKLM
jgi:predicted Rossmann fold nucleotide-binding protein DprA/Smf involved in DNA uptake